MKNQHRKNRILLVDDQPSTLDSLMAALQDQGFDVFVETTGEQAIRRADFIVPDVILLAVVLPDGDGFDTCRRLKGFERTREIPVIFTSMQATTETKVRGFEVGGVDCVTKPFEIEEVLARIAMHLALLRTREADKTQNILLQREIAERKRVEEILRRYREHLQELVDERTSELKKANEQLEKEIAERNRAEEALRLNAERTATLLRLNQMTGETVRELMEFAFEEALRFTKSKVGYLAFLDEKETVLTMQLWSRTAMAECAIADKPIRYPVDTTGLWGEAVRQRKPIITNDYNAPNPWKKGYPEGHIKLFRHMNVPVIAGNRIVLVAGVGNKDEAYDETDVQHLTLLMEGMWRLIERNRAAEELKAHRDHLEVLVGERTAELVVAKEQAEAANAAKSDFLARMSHEIRTPLNAVTGLTNVVLKSELTPQQRDYLNKVRIASNNLLEVINDILDFSKVEAGRLELSHAPFNLDQVLEQLVDLFSQRTAQKDLEMIFTVAPDVPRQLAGDAGRLTQVLTNLVENAVKFTDKGEIVVRVELDEERGTSNARRDEPAVLRFSITDTGIGISTDTLPTLFEPFTQAEGYISRKHEGTGLGLAICHRLVELMGGRIWCNSTPGEGSTFAFTVRLKIRPQAEDKPTFGLSSDLRGLKTLVVDNCAAARQVLIDMLESFKCTVTALDSGEKAIEALRRAAADEAYQLVLLDWKMPGLDGIGTAAAIRNDPNLHSPPIIILVTAYGRELVQERIDAEAVDTMLLKPVKPSELFDTIMALFARSGAMAPRRAQVPAVRLIQQLRGRRVLVVEDSELNRDVAVALIKEAGLIVETAVNGRNAVDMINWSPRSHYDAVLMDIQMPVMDGYEATRHIRQWEHPQPETINRPGTHLPIIALTAHALKGEKEKCLGAGMDDYLAKPIDEQELYRLLLKWIAPRMDPTSLRLQPPSFEDPQGPTDASACLDVQGALQRLGGRKALYAKILGRFKTEFCTVDNTIRQCLAQGDTKTAMRIAHTVKGSAGAIGAAVLMEASADLEQAAAGKRQDLEVCMERFGTALGHALEVVSKRLGTDSAPE